MNSWCRWRAHALADDAAVEHVARERVEAAHQVVAIHALNGRAAGVTANVGIVRGGSRTNVVAESASIDLEVRAPTRHDLESVETAVRAVASQPTIEGTRTTVEVISRHWPLERTDLSGRLVAHAVEFVVIADTLFDVAFLGGGLVDHVAQGQGGAAVDQLADDHAAGDDCEIGRQGALAAEMPQHSHVVVDNGQEDFGSEIFAVGVR